MSTLSKDLPEAEALSDDAIIIIGNPSTGKLFRTTVAELKNMLGPSLPPGGTAKQVLTKKTNADGDAEWANAAAGAPTMLATGTNTYIATNTPPVTALPKAVYIQFVNACTGNGTIKIDDLATLPIKLNGANLLPNNILAGAVKLLLLAPDSSHYQLQGGTWDIPAVSAGQEKVVSKKSDGLYVNYDIKDANSASATTGSVLAGLDWSMGSVHYTGVAGETRFYGDWKYECIGDNVWWRTPYNVLLNDIIIGSVNDSGGVKTSIQMAALYPNAVSPQIVKGTAGIYQYFGLLGWFYFENKIAI